MENEDFSQLLVRFVEKKMHDKHDEISKKVEAELISLSKCFFIPKDFAKSLIERYNGICIDESLYETYNGYLENACCGTGKVEGEFDIIVEDLINVFRLKDIK